MVGSKRRQLATGLALSALALLVAFSGDLITPSNWITPTQSATFFPAAALIGTALCGAYIAFGKSTEDGRDRLFSEVNGRAILTGVVVFAYAISVPYAGLIASTFALSIGLPLLLGYRNWIAIFFLSVTILALSWTIFIQLMGLPLKL